MNQILVLLGVAAWKPYLSALILPPVPLIALMLLSAWLIVSRRALGWTLMLLCAALTWFSATTGTARLLAQTLLKPAPALSRAGIAEIRAQVQAKQPVAIVVLGGGLQPLAPEYGVSNLTRQSLERLRYGLWLGRETGAPVGFSGGVGWGQPSETMPEARIAARIASQEFGRPLGWVEDASRDTRENAALTIALMKAQGIREIVLVTHDVHQPRALRAFEDAAQGAIRIVPAPLGTLSLPATRALVWLPSEGGFSDVRRVLHEALGRLFGA